MNQKNIINLSPEYFDHAYDYFTFEKIRMHDRNHYRIVLVYLKRKTDQPNRMEQEGFTCYYLFDNNKKPRLIPAVSKLIRILKDEQADLIHAHNRACIVCAVWAKIFVPRVKILAHVHSFNIVRKFKRRLFYQLLGRKIDCLTGCSESTTLFLRNHVPGISPNKITTIPNSISADRFSHPTVDRETVRNEWNLSSNQFLFIAAGRLAKEKGFNHLIQAFKTVHEQHPQARLLIAGEGPEHERLKTQIENLNMHPSIILAGFRQDTVNLFHAADCFVLSSLKETFGLVVLEAIAADCPVIATDCGGVKDILSSPDYGTLIPLADVNALTDAMLRTLERPPDRLKKQTDTAKLAALTFSHKNAVMITENIYTQLIGS